MYHPSDSGFASASLTENAVPNIHTELEISHPESLVEESAKRIKVEMSDPDSQTLASHFKTVGTQTLPNGLDNCVAMLKKYKQLLVKLRLENSRYRRMQKEQKTSDVPPVNCFKEVTVLKITTKYKHPIKILKLKSLHEFINDGTALLGLDVNNALQLRTEDGCDIDNDDGLLYCVQNKKMVIFEQCNAETSSDNRAPSGSTSTTTTAATTFDDAQAESSKPLKWPAVYKLPKMGNILVGQIRSCTTKEEAGVLKCNRVFTNNFLQTIVKDVIRYTGREAYLTRLQFQAIGEAIRCEYPILMDRDGSWESLKQKFCRKLQYERTKNCSDKRQEMRERYTPKCLRKKNESDTEGPPLKKVMASSVEDRELASIVNLTDFVNIVDQKTVSSSHDDYDAQLSRLFINDNDGDVDEDGDAIPLPNFSVQSPPRGKKNHPNALQLNLLRPPSSSATKLNDIIDETKSLLEKTFLSRKDQTIKLNVAQEIAACPPLECSVYLVHEAELVLRTIRITKRSPYMSPNLDGIDTWVARLKKHLTYAGVALFQPNKKDMFDLIQFPKDSDDMKIWRGFLCIISRAKESPYAFFEEEKETVRIGGAPYQPENVVHVDDCKIRTGSPIESICILVAAYLAFGLCHSRNQATTLEILEGMLKLRHSFSRMAAKGLLKSMSIL